MVLTFLLLAVGLALQLMKQGAMMTVLSTLLTALAWPAVLLAATDFIDSKWTIAVDRYFFALNYKRGMELLDGKREKTVKQFHFHVNCMCAELGGEGGVLYLSAS